MARNNSGSEAQEARPSADRDLQSFLLDRTAALERLLPSPRDTRAIDQETIQESLAHVKALAKKAAAENHPQIGTACRLAVLLLEDATTYGYSFRDHGYVINVLLPFLKRCESQLGQPVSRASVARNELVVLKATGEADFQNFYDFVSATQRIRLRMDSFKILRGYHYKDHFYIRRLLQGGPPVARVLDVGCCGTVYPDLFDLGRVEYVGVDISQISLDRMAEIYRGKPIRWVKDDATTLGAVENGAFDLILATQVLEHLPDPETALANMVSKLKIRGRLMIGTESALRGGGAGRLQRLLASASLLLGSYYLVRSMFPYAFPHRQVDSYIDLEGNYRTIAVPHFHFHPLFFERVLREQNLPARVSFLRVSGLISLYRLGPAWHFRAQELKAMLPILRYIGSQIFVAIERTAGDPGR